MLKFIEHPLTNDSIDDEVANKTVRFHDPIDRPPLAKNFQSEALGEFIRSFVFFFHQFALGCSFYDVLMFVQRMIFVNMSHVCLIHQSPLKARYFTLSEYYKKYKISQRLYQYGFSLARHSLEIKAKHQSTPARSRITRIDQKREKSIRKSL